MHLVTNNFKNFRLGLVDSISRGESLNFKVDVQLKEL